MVSSDGAILGHGVQGSHIGFGYDLDAISSSASLIALDFAAFVQPGS